jgi:hypothetical protein
MDEGYDLLSFVKMRPTSNQNTVRVEFMDSREVKRKGGKSELLTSRPEMREEPFIVVSRLREQLRDQLRNPVGYKLSKWNLYEGVGNVVKLGRV